MIGPNFFVTTHMTEGRFIASRNPKNSLEKNVIFSNFRNPSMLTEKYAKPNFIKECIIYLFLNFINETILVCSNFSTRTTDFNILAEIPKKLVSSQKFNDQMS